MTKFDAIVIGTGQAGPSPTARLSKEGLKTAVIAGGLGGADISGFVNVPSATPLAVLKFLSRRLLT